MALKLLPVTKPKELVTKHITKIVNSLISFWLNLEEKKKKDLIRTFVRIEIVIEDTKTTCKAEILNWLMANATPHKETIQKHFSIQQIK